MSTNSEKTGARIVIPNKWEPRKYQLPFWRFFAREAPGMRAVKVWHRRAGKDSTDLNMTCVKAHMRKGNYWHLLPEAEQARKAVWEAIDRQGRRVIDQVFPEELRSNTLKNEMKIDLRCGSTWQLAGSDNYDSLVGSNPVGVVFSDFSLSNPAAWDFIRPILLENGGWALFNLTPRGKNHGYHLYRMAQKLAQTDPEHWFCELLTVNDTMVITPEEIQRERDSGMSDEMVDQEYFCSFEGVQVGAIYGEYMSKARAEGRIGKVPYTRALPVNTFWDIGHGDAAVMIAHQQVIAQDRFLRGYSATGQDMPHFVQQLRAWSDEHGYVYGTHYLPHDAKNVTMASKSNPLGKSIYDQAIALGMTNIKVVPRTPDLWTAILATRSKFNTAVFDEEGCGGMTGLINALESYHKVWDESRKCFGEQPKHDWSSNYCDAFRQWAQGFTPTGTSGVFTLPGAPTQPGPRFTKAVVTVGSRRAGY